MSKWNLNACGIGMAKKVIFWDIFTSLESVYIVDDIVDCSCIYSEVSEGFLK